MWWLVYVGWCGWVGIGLCRFVWWVGVGGLVQYGWVGVHGWVGGVGWCVSIPSKCFFKLKFTLIDGN